MFTSIAQVEAMLSDEMAHRVTWGQFVNWNGGQGMNIACDMAQGICNKVSKDVVKGMGANKTTKAMVRVSRPEQLLSSKSYRQWTQHRM